jgi:hypothetical protein
MKQTFALAVILVIACSSCKKSSNLSKIPSIAYIGISTDSVNSGSSTQKIDLTFNFTDGDGDLGNDPKSGVYDIYTTDSRDDSAYNYFFPAQLPDVIEPGKGIEGSCTITIDAAFLILRPDHPKGDTLHFDVYIRDKAGNTSNHITTSNIYIKP